MIKKSVRKNGTVSVTFELPAEAGGETVHLVGDFNDWSKDATPLTRRKDGRFSTSLTLAPGRAYRYRYLVDGHRWENDWAADAYAPNEHGGDDSVVEVWALQMRWSAGRRSGNLEDRRGQRVGLPMGRVGGLGGLLVAIVLALLGGPQILGSDGGPAFDVDGGPLGSIGETGDGTAVDGAPDPDAKLVDFVSFVLDDVQQSFRDVFRAAGREYDDARLVLFTTAVRSGCGTASSATGPFYCQLDSTVYVDLGFFQELSRRFQAPGDFAQAYVIAHEIGHHVQNQLGIAARVRELAQERPGDADELSIRQELQADCLAGVWAHSTYERGLLEEGDLEEGLTAASAVGDDRIQRQATGRVDQETWTHGSSEQRMKWFRRGFDSGDPDRCGTFEADSA